MYLGMVVYIVTPVFKLLRQKDHKFEVSLGYQNLVSKIKNKVKKKKRM
jgi:hypothetical protein